KVRSPTARLDRAPKESRFFSVISWLPLRAEKRAAKRPQGCHRPRDVSTTGEGTRPSKSLLRGRKRVFGSFRDVRPHRSASVVGRPPASGRGGRVRASAAVVVDDGFVSVVVVVVGRSRRCATTGARMRRRRHGRTRRRVHALEIRRTTFSSRRSTPTLAANVER